MDLGKNRIIWGFEILGIRNIWGFEMGNDLQKPTFKKSGPWRRVTASSCSARIHWGHVVDENSSSSRRLWIVGFWGEVLRLNPIIYIYPIIVSHYIHNYIIIYILYIEFQCDKNSKGSRESFAKPVKPAAMASLHQSLTVLPTGKPYPSFTRNGPSIP